MNLRQALIYLTAMVFFVYGLAFVIQPLEMISWLTGEAPTNASAITDMRATYGGMSVATGLILFYLGSLKRLRAGLGAVAILMVGMAGGRIVGIIADGDSNHLMYGYLVLEIIAAALALWALKTIDSREL